MGLKLEVFLFNNRQDTITRAQKLIQNYKDGEDNEDEDDTDGEDSDSDYYLSDDDFEEEEFIPSVCRCHFCNSLNSINEIWNSWIPETNIEKILKKNIDKIKFN